MGNQGKKFRDTDINGHKTQDEDKQNTAQNIKTTSNTNTTTTLAFAMVHVFLILFQLCFSYIEAVTCIARE